MKDFAESFMHGPQVMESNNDSFISINVLKKGGSLLGEQGSK